MLKMRVCDSAETTTEAIEATEEEGGRITGRKKREPQESKRCEEQ